MSPLQLRMTGTNFNVVARAAHLYFFLQGSDQISLFADECLQASARDFDITPLVAAASETVNESLCTMTTR